MQKGKCLIGTSGWYYRHWQGRFYPNTLSKDKLLPFFSRYFNTVELNNSFYRLPEEKVVLAWRKKTPKGFLFAVKASRFITHIKRLDNLGDSLKLFLGRMGSLGEKMGPLLYQLPPSMKKDAKRLARFLKRLPQKQRYVIEFRHLSWLDKEIFSLLKQFNVAHCIISKPDFPIAVETTADFSYIRMHGGSRLYRSNYSRAELSKWAGIINRLLKSGLDTYVYFNNDACAYAVKNALSLKKLLS